MQTIRKIILIFICLLLSSCMKSSIGPKIAKHELFQYNDAFAHAKAQSLLLNIVRLRYDHTPVQLAISSASSNKSVTTTLNGNASSNWGGVPPFATTVTGTAGGSGSFSYSDNPVIQFNPIDGQQFQNEFLRALNLKNIALLLESQWSIARIFRLCVQQAGGSVNASSAARPTSHHIPKWKAFDQMVYVLRRIQLDDGFVSYWGSADGRETLELHLYPHIKLSKREINILKNADVKVKNGIIRFTNYPGPDDTFVVTRSILGSMNYLSKGVEVPPALVDRNLVVQTRYRNGKPFDWQQVVRGMSKIYSGTEKPNPEITDTAIQFHGYWYWVDERDPNTKQSMMLIQYLLGLIQTQTASSGAGGLGGSGLIYSIPTR